MKTQLNTQPTRTQSARTTSRYLHSSTQVSNSLSGEQSSRRSSSVALVQEEDDEDNYHLDEHQLLEHDLPVSEESEEGGRDLREKGLEQSPSYRPLKGQSSQGAVEQPVGKEIVLPPFLEKRPLSQEPYSPRPHAINRSAPEEMAGSTQQATESRSLDPQTQSQLGIGPSRKTPALASSLSKEEVQHQLAEGMHHLESQVSYINQLSDEMEAALLGFKLVSNKVLQYRQQMQQFEQGASAEQDWTAPESPVVAIPCIQQPRNGDYHLTVRQVDLFRAERDAAATARFLRDRVQYPTHPRPQKTPASPGTPQQPTRSAQYTAVQRPAQSRGRSRGWRWLRNILKVPHSPLLKGMDALVWITVAAAVRVSLQLIFTLYPVLLIPATLLLVTSALVTAYQTLFMTRSGTVFGYRLFLIIVGLLVGGRL